MSGFLYVLSNPSLPKYLKIGYTNRTLEQRLSELNNTSIPLPFQIELYCIVDDAESVERTVHAELVKKNYVKEKEFFLISPKMAVKEIKNMIASNLFFANDLGGISSSLYLTETDKSQLNEALLLSKKTKILEKKKKDEHQAWIEKKTDEFFQLVCDAYEIIEKYHNNNRDVNIISQIWDWERAYEKLGASFALQMTSAEKASMKKVWIYYNNISDDFKITELVTRRVIRKYRPKDNYTGGILLFQCVRTFPHIYLDGVEDCAFGFNPTFNGILSTFSKNK
jgi:hypothetical protein